MTTKVFCDVCDEESRDKTVKVTVKNGVSYHNGDPETKKIDCCIECLQLMKNLNNYEELDALRSASRQERRCK